MLYKMFFAITPSSNKARALPVDSSRKYCSLNSLLNSGQPARELIIIMLL